MLNVNSPIVQNLGGMSPGIPPNVTMGSNMIGIGNNGYNQQHLGGYYNNNYYVNPYLQQYQEKLRIAEERENNRKQADVWKTIARKVAAALGNEVDEEKLKELYDPKYVENYSEDAIGIPIKIKIIKDGEKEHIFEECGSGKPLPIQLQAVSANSSLMNLHLNWTGRNPYLESSILKMNQMYEENKKRFPDDISLSQFLQNAGELYVESMIDKSRQQRKDKTQVYSPGDYSQLINMHSNSRSFFPEVFGQQRPDIGDMEIRLPDHLKTERQARKELFLNAILSKRR